MRISGNPEFDNVEDALSAAFDFLSNMIVDNSKNSTSKKNISKEKCLENCIRKPLRSNEIIVFHDSEKAYEKMIFTLPKFIEHALEKGFSFELLK